MITNQDLTAVNLSPTKKDFYQIWNELLDVAKKLSERWDPTSTNESDPGIVLLKVLTAIADKLNYNIDKNILEAFMPSAAQEESMRKLCDMMGYNIKYYQSAVAKVKIAFTGQLPEEATTIAIKQFTNITNNDKDINYIVIGDENGDPAPTFTLNISKQSQVLSRILTCIEGELVQCESNNDNIISAAQLDDKHRYYLPENQIAENGIFIYNIDNSGEIDNSSAWIKVDNLNTATIGEPVYKFGYDSREARPYIQFPDDINQLIKNGLNIYYTRTSGVNGNISARTLSSIINFDQIIPEGSTITESDFTITNEEAATNGTNIETITQAYESFKKTIGTFDTLVTCRDYMNKIYQLTDTTGISLVSNIIVSDIRDDINKAVTLCTFSDYGISYIDEALKIATGVNDEFKQIGHFDLILYPFKKIVGLNNYSEYVNSFTTDPTVIDEIIQKIKQYKTLSHIFNTCADKDNILCIKNYLKLNARITTINKVNVAEQADILANIKEAIYKSFNMHQLDFGEEIPFESILACIEKADARIKNVALDEPILDTRFLVYDVDSEVNEITYSSTDTGDKKIKYNKIYNKLALRNVLAGRVELFDYDTTFSTSYTEQNVTLLPTDSKQIVALKPSFTISTTDLMSSALKQNEIIKFRAPNFKTIITYPAYVRYRYEGANVGAGDDHSLTAVEKLYISYEDQNGAQICKLYEVDSIINPNFDLSQIDESKSSVKAVNFKKADGTIITIKMDILGANEQISIKEKSEVKFEDSRTNLYWILNNADNSIILDNNSYILQDGEYLFYTDRSKTALAYYGTGTELIFTGVDQNSLKNLTKTVSVEDILLNGITAIPWRLFNFNHDTNYLTIAEYQYRTLTTNDKVDSITMTDSTIDSTWKPCTAASYTYADETSETLPVLGQGNWQVRSYLALDVGQNRAQTLARSNDIVAIEYKNGSSTTTDSTTLVGPDVSFKTSYDCQAIVDSFDTTLAYLKQISGLDNLEEFKIKKFSIDPSIENSNVTLNNFGSDYTWTKVDVNILTDLTLNTSIPANHYGLIMFYLTTNNSASSEVTNNMYLTTNDSDTSHPALTIFNKVSNAGYVVENLEFEWWDNYVVDTNKYVLKKGINIVYITNDIKTITIHKRSSTADVSVIFSNLDIIKYDNDHPFGINTNLIGYKNIPDSATPDRAIDIKVLQDIKIILGDKVNNFYYDCPMDNSTVLSINKEAIDTNTNTKENLASPRLWYDYNNMNNKFVISEIDADYLQTGIQIAQSSKR